MTVRKTALLILALLAVVALMPQTPARAAPSAAALGCPAIFSNSTLTVNLERNGRINLVWTIKKGKSENGEVVEATTSQHIDFYPDLFPVLLDSPMSGQGGVIFAGLPAAILVKYPLTNHLIRPAAYWKSPALTTGDSGSGDAPPGSPYYPHPKWHYSLKCEYTYEAVSLLADLYNPNGFAYPYPLNGNGAGDLVTFPWFYREFTPGHAVASQTTPNVYDSRLQNILAALAAPCRYAHPLWEFYPTAAHAYRLCQEVLDAYLAQDASSVVVSERPAELPGQSYKPLYQAYSRPLALGVGIKVKGTLQATREDCEEQWDPIRGWHDVCSTSRRTESAEVMFYAQVPFPGSAKEFLPVRNRSQALGSLAPASSQALGSLAPANGLPPKSIVFAHDPRTGEPLYNLSGLQFTGSASLQTIGYTGVLIP